jgi:hypothetical protein
MVLARREQTTDTPLSKRVRAAGLKAGIDGFALEGEHADDAFVDAPQRLAADEPFECFDAERELAEGERSLAPEPALAQARDVSRLRVLGQT